MNLNGDVLKGWLRRMDAMEKGATRKEQFIRAIESQLTRNLPGHPSGAISTWSKSELFRDSCICFKYNVLRKRTISIGREKVRTLSGGQF